MNDDLGFLLGGVDESDVVSFEKNSADLVASLRLHVHLLGFVEHDIHELVESDDVALETVGDILVQPDLDPSAVLEISEDEVHRLNHHFVELSRRHFCGMISNLGN